MKIDRRKLATAWRKRADELLTIAAECRTRSEWLRADQFERAATGYADDADRLDAGLPLRSPRRQRQTGVIRP